LIALLAEHVRAWSCDFLIIINLHAQAAFVRLPDFNGGNFSDCSWPIFTPRLIEVTGIWADGRGDSREAGRGFLRDSLLGLPQDESTCLLT
jgi:hypothetical protein